MPQDPTRSIDYRAFLESTPLVPWEYDSITERVTFVGPQAEAFLGYPAEAWLDPSFWADHVLPDDQAGVAAARSALRSTCASHVIEYRMEHAAGHVIWVSETASCVTADGAVCCVRGLLSDVTERKRLELSLARGEERLRAILRGAPDAMVLTDPAGTILNMNEQAEYLTGYRLEEIVGSCVDLLAADRLRERAAALRSTLSETPTRRSLVDGHTFALTRRDGEEVPVEISVSVIPSLAGPQLLYAARDLTARLRVEAQLGASEARFRGMADILPGMVSFVGTDQRYRFVNAAYAAWAGGTPAEMEGKTVLEVLGEDLYERVRDRIEAALRGETVQDRIVAKRPGDVTDIPLDLHYVPDFDGDTVDGYFVVLVEAGSEMLAESLPRPPRVGPPPTL